MSKTFHMIAILAALSMMSWECAARRAMEPAVLEVDAQLTIVPGGGNSAIFVGEQEVVVVDTKMGGGAKRLREQVDARAGGDRPVTVIITHYHPDHVGGYELYPGSRVLAGSYTREDWAKQSGGLPYPDTVVADTLVLDMGNEEILLINTGQGHTLNDLVVYFRQRKVLLTGDLVFAGRHPVLLARVGSHTGAWQATLEGLLARFPMDITVVPGHGPAGDMAVVAEMRDYFAGVRGALGDRQALREVRRKYRGYGSFPGFASMRHTVRVMRKEADQQR